MKVNLKKLYPFYDHDEYVDLPEELVLEILYWERKERAYQLKAYRHKAYYSLDVANGIENSAVFIARTPDEIYEQKVTREQLHAAMSTLTDKQASRIYAYYFLGLNHSKIARSEGVDPSTVRVSILNGLKKIEVFLKNHDDENPNYNAK